MQVTTVKWLDIQMIKCYVWSQGRPHEIYLSMHFTEMYLRHTNLKMSFKKVEKEAWLGKHERVHPNPLHLESGFIYAVTHM